jgi:hypothetical protein
LRFRSLLLLTLLTACGPGAADRGAIPASEATYDLYNEATWAAAGSLDNPLTGDFTCDGPCATENAAVPAPLPVRDMRATYGPGGDADTATIVWRGRLPDGVSVVAVPVVVGPDGSRASVSATCGGVTRTLRHARGEWAYWRLHLKRTGGSCELEIRAVDDGDAWGQWIAIGAPMIVR